MNRIPQTACSINAPARPSITTATNTSELLAALIGPENTVCRTPQWITDEMPYYVAQTNRILWERWEAAAVALFNLRNDSTSDLASISTNHVWIGRLLRRFPNIDSLFPADYFEPDCEECDVYDSSNRFGEVFH